MKCPCMGMLEYFCLKFKDPYGEVATLKSGDFNYDLWKDMKNIHICGIVVRSNEREVDYYFNCSNTSVSKRTGDFRFRASFDLENVEVHRAIVSFINEFRYIASIKSLTDFYGTKAPVFVSKESLESYRRTKLGYEILAEPTFGKPAGCEDDTEFMSEVQEIDAFFLCGAAM